MLQAKERILDTDEIKWLGEKLALYEPLTYNQHDFHASLFDILWLFGGNQSGKTHTNMIDLAMLALDIHPYRHTTPASVHWACIESWDQVRDILWEENLERFIPRHHIQEIRYGQDKVPRKIYLVNGNRIEFKAFNQGRSLFQGRAIDSAYCDEQCHHDFQGIFNELQARVLQRRGRISWSMTPILPQPYLEERLDDLPDTDEVFHLDLEDNKLSRGGYIPDKKIDDMIDEWPEETQATRIKGRFASFYGAVFRTFSRAVHVVKPFPIPKTWPRYRGVDFGFTNPFACLWFARDKDDNWYVYREYYRSKTGIGTHINNIKRLSKDEQYVCPIIADPENAEDRAELRNAGIPTRPARKAVARGIEVVQSKLKIKANGKPSLRIFNTCKNTCREFAIYHYPTGTNTKDPKDIPVQKDDHTIDVIRYVLYTIEKPAKKGSVLVA